MIPIPPAVAPGPLQPQQPILAEPARRLMRRPEDTSSGCRDRAAASVIAAAAMDTVNGRTRLEASAATWTVRADLLERLELRQQARESLPAEESVRL